jgi:hypothetical protein
MVSRRNNETCKRSNESYVVKAGIYIRKSIKKISKRKVKGLRITLDFSFTCLLKSYQSVFLDYPTRQNLILIEQLLIYI